MRRNAHLLLLALPVLFAGKCKDKAPPDDIDETDDDGEISTATAIKLIEVVPAQVPPSTTTAATLYGSGFQDGAELSVGPHSGQRTIFDDGNTLRVELPGLPQGTYDLVVSNPDGERATLRQGLLVDSGEDPALAGLDCDALVVQFAFDSSGLDDAGRATLDKYLPCFTARSGTVRVAGHADERGTTEYNLALGQRRAEAIRKYLVSKNVVPSRIRSVSFGEEKPLDPAHDEAAWQRNRRGEVGVSQ